MPYTVSTPVFEGPLDLLLHLISREQVDLWEVSLSDIVDGYVRTLERMRAALDLDVATEFLLIASVLVELKARRLLPGRDDVDLEEELALWEERDLLLARLLECKTFKDASSALQRLIDHASLSQPRTSGPDERYAGLAPDLLAGVTPDALHAAMTSLLAPRPQARLLLDHVAPIRASVSDAVEVLVDRLPCAGRLSFTEITDDATTRLEVIVRFLALLELYKRGAVDLEQSGTFATLYVTWLGADASVGEAEEYHG